jgi:hypothetical protein
MVMICCFSRAWMIRIVVTRGGTEDQVLSNAKESGQIRSRSMSIRYYANVIVMMTRIIIWWQHLMNLLRRLIGIVILGRGV